MAGKYCSRCAARKDESEFIGADNKARQTCTSCRTQINAYQRDKRAAYRSNLHVQKLCNQVTSCLTMPWPIYPGSEIAAATGAEEGRSGQKQGGGDQVAAGVAGSAKDLPGGVHSQASEGKDEVVIGSWGDMTIKRAGHVSKR